MPDVRRGPPQKPCQTIVPVGPVEACAVGASGGAPFVKSGARNDARMAHVPGFAQLDDDDQGALVRYISALGAPAQQALARVIRDELPRLPHAEKPERLRQFIGRQEGLPMHWFPAPHLLGGPQVRPRLSGPIEGRPITFESDNLDTVQYTIHIDGRDLPIYVPKSVERDQTYAMHPMKIAFAVSSLPKTARDQILGIGLNPTMHDKLAFMHAGANGNVTIFPLPMRPNPTLSIKALTHEAGHVLSMRLWGKDASSDNGSGGWDRWRLAADSDRLAISGYARTDIREDFAETYALYLFVAGKSDESKYRQMLPERFRLLDELFDRAG